VDLNATNTRVDQALTANKRAERLIICMALGLFCVGLSVLLVGYRMKNPYVAGGSTLAQVFLAFPINEVRKLRRDNLILQVFPVLIQNLPPAKAASEVVKLLDHLRRGKS
jgi:hypothetical protein